MKHDKIVIIHHFIKMSPSHWRILQACKMKAFHLLGTRNVIIGKAIVKQNFFLLRFYAIRFLKKLGGQLICRNLFYWTKFYHLFLNCSYFQQINPYLAAYKMLIKKKILPILQCIQYTGVLTGWWGIYQTLWEMAVVLEWLKVSSNLRITL